MKPAHSPIHPHGSFVFEVIGRLFQLAEKSVAKNDTIATNLPDSPVPFLFSFAFSQRAVSRLK